MDQVGPQRDTAPGAPGHEVTHRRVLSWIYGLVVCSAVLAASTSLASGWQVATFVFVSLVVYWAAETYAHLLATRTVLARELHRGEIVDTMAEGWHLVSASYLPLTVVVGATLVGAEVVTIVLLGLIASTVLLFLAGWNASYRSGLRGARLVLSSLVAGLFGLVMIALKLVLH